MASTLQQTIRAVRRRRRLDAAIDGAAWGLAIASAGAAAMVAADRLIGLPGPEWLWAAILAAGLLAGAATAFLRPMTALELAVDLDRRWQLKDRLGTAVALADGGGSPWNDPEFIALALREGDECAARVSAPAAVPIRITRAWGVTLLLFAGLGAALLLVPRRAPVSVAAATPDEEVEPAQALRVELQQSIQRIDAALEEHAVDGAALPVLDEQAASLDRLSQQMTGEPDVPGEVREQSAAELSELADELAERAQRDLAAADAVAQRFSSLEAPQAPPSTNEVIESLRRGNLQDAAAQLNDLLERSATMPPPEREEAAEHLRDIGDAIERLSQTDPAEAGERAARLEEVLREEGLSEEEARQLLEGSPEDSEQALRERGIDPELAHELAREQESLQEQQEAHEQANRDTEAVSDALRQAAEELDGREHPPRDEQAPEGDPSDAKEQNQAREDGATPTTKGTERAPNESQQAERSERARGEPKPTADRERTGGEQQPAGGAERQVAQERAEPSDRTGHGQREGQAPRPAAAEKSTPSQDGTSQSGEQPSENAEGERPRPQPGPPSPQDRESSAPRPGAGDRRETVESAEESAASDGAAKRESADEKGRTPGAAGEAQAEDNSPGGALRRLAERHRRASDAQRLSERLHEQARQMAEATERRDGSSPGSDDGDREPGLASAPSQRGGGERFAPDGTQDLDLGGEEPGAPMVGDLFGEGGDAAPRADPETARRVVREARQVAERAVDESVVPSRYHRLIRRYFGRLEETAQRPGQDH